MADEAAAHSPGRSKSRVKRVPIADLKRNTFAQRRSVQGTIDLCEPAQLSQGRVETRTFWLKDIAVSNSEAIAAAGLDPRLTDAVREEQAKRRKTDFPAVHQIAVVLCGPFIDVDIAQGDVVLLRGEDIIVENNPGRMPGDHEFQIRIESGDCTLEIIAVDRVKSRSQNYVYLNTVRIVSLGPNGTLETARFDAKQHQAPSQAIKLGQLVPGKDLEEVYGILTNMSFPVRTQKGTFRVAIMLCDETPDTLAHSVEATAFPDEDKFLDFLPAMSCFGTIVRLRHVRTQAYQGKPNILMFSHSSNMSITGMVKGNRTVTHARLNNTVSKSDLDWDRVEELREFAAKVLAEQAKPPFLYNQYLRTITGAMQGPLNETPFVDLLAQVITTPPMLSVEDDHGTCEFRVTDGLTEATVRMYEEEHNNEGRNQYWQLVRAFVGDEPGVWIKFRNCQIIRASNLILLHTGHSWRNVSTVFRVPQEICEALTPTASIPAARRQIISRVQGEASSFAIMTVAQILEGQRDPPFRAMVRVTKIYPDDVSRFCKRKADGTRHYAIALQVEDMTGRLDVVLAGQDASDFFQLPAMDLSTNAAAKHMLQTLVDLMCDENHWLECALIPLHPERKLYSILDTFIISPA